MDIAEARSTWLREEYREALEEAVALDPNFTRAWAELAGYLAHCRRALRLKNDSYQAWANLGMISAARGEYDQAIGAYHASLERKVDQPQVLVDLGNVYLRQGRPKAAMRNFDMVCRRYPRARS